LHASSLQCFKVSPYSCWESHAPHHSTECRDASVYYTELNSSLIDGPQRKTQLLTSSGASRR